ncbi:MAG: LUD domain-containing protein, partial [Anaerolineae bacterium]|nr:LUD domain-containing protein [Anaerolineae bacterium]
MLSVDDTSPEALTERFQNAMAVLKGDALVAHGDVAARDMVIDLLRRHDITHILAWDFSHIPVADLEAEVRNAGITITIPNTHEERSADTMQWLGSAGAGLTGADAAIAATGTLVLSTGTGKGRIPTVLPPIWISIVSSSHLFACIEDWVAQQRTLGMAAIHERANLAFVTG